MGFRVLGFEFRVKRLGKLGAWETKAVRRLLGSARQGWQYELATQGGRSDNDPRSGERFGA